MSLEDIPQLISKKSKKKQDPATLTYNSGRVIGQGCFAVVCQGIAVETNWTVAIKKIFQDDRFVSRELQIHQTLRHPNVVQYLHAFYQQGTEDKGNYLNLVMEYLPSSLYKVSRQYVRNKQSMPSILIKLYAYQMLRGVGYIHANNIIHRDIKPQNFLVDNQTNVVKLCDFGSAKYYNSEEKSVTYISSRYYRAPELIFGNENYDFAIDLWGVGCIIAQLILGTPLFKAKNNIDLLVQIIKVKGTPNREEIQNMNPLYAQCDLPQIKATRWHKVFKNEIYNDAVDLIQQLLEYSPQSRPTAYQALAHDYFNDLRNQRAVLPNGENLPDIFNWTEEEIEFAGNTLLDQITPNWAR